MFWCSAAMLLFRFSLLYFFFQAESKIMWQNWRVMKYLLIKLSAPRAAAVVPRNKVTKIKIKKCGFFRAKAAQHFKERSASVATLRFTPLSSLAAPMATLPDAGGS